MGSPSAAARTAQLPLPSSAAASAAAARAAAARRMMEMATENCQSVAAAMSNPV